MELTRRDLGVLRTLAEFGLATREQLQALFFPSRETASIRLKLMFHHGFVERLIYPRPFFDLGDLEPSTSSTFGSPPMVYALTGEGWELMAAFLGEEEAQALQARTPDLRSPYFLSHRLAVIDLRVALLCAAQNRPDEALLAWHEETAAQQEWALSGDGRGPVIRLRPDGLFCYGMGEKKGRRDHAAAVPAACFHQRT
jgi:hypothetical protein